MNCDQIIKREIAERYLLRGLSEADQEAFEQHYFECPRCFEELQTYRALQLELKRAAPAISAERADTRIGSTWAWAAAAAVAVLVIGVSTWLREKGPVTRSVQTPVQQAPARQQPVEPSVPSLSELTQVQPPPYVPATFRGPEDEARRQFRQAMQLYSKGDFQAAISGLRSASKLDPKAPDISFFLGVCYLLTGRPDTAINHLRATVPLGDSPYLEDAHFYLAKAYIQKRNLDAARGELRKLIELQGERKKEAQWLMEQIELLEKTQP
jgi:tetratricopeptide (TPR) repeat protein